MTTTGANLDAARLARLVEASRILNSTTNKEDLLDYIIKEAAELTNTEATSILLLDPNTRQLYFVAASNEIEPQMANTPVSLENSIAGAILTANKPLYIPNVAEDPRWNKNIDQAIDFKTQEILGVPMRDVNGEPVGVLEAINKLEGNFNREDVETLSALADLAGVAVEKARLIEELQDAYAEISELDHLKTDFIAVASHELRTPLAIILGYVSFLRDEAPPEMAKHMDSVLEASNRLRRLIQEMLNFQYTDAGEDSLKAEQLNVPDMLQIIVAENDEPARAKELTVTIHVADNKIPIKADRETMAVAIGNLVNNAIKFTTKGGQVDIYAETRSNEVWIRVEDTGVGIPNDKLERIFKRFYQVEHHLNRRHEGMGLGLAISKELVELNNGRIWAESTIGEGSRFYIVLPLAK